jgi:spore coat protein H
MSHFAKKISGYPTNLAMSQPIHRFRAGGLSVAVLAVAVATFAGPVVSAQDAKTSTKAAEATGADDTAEATSDDFYRPDEVQSVNLRVDKADLERMRAALPERIAVKASFRWRDISLDNVAIRYKGNSSSHPAQKHKRSFLIKFNEYDGDQRFLGLRRASLDNGVQFGSLLSEPIITEILRDQGVVTHRCNYARLFLNDEYQGVYVNVERIDESFIEHHLPDPNGLLFKVDEGGPGGNLQFIGDDPADYARAFEPQTKSAAKGQQQLVDFIKLINQSDKSEFAANLEAKLETDDFLRTTAVLLLAGAFDQLTGWHPHNYYLYHDGRHDRWRYLPWDLDVGFSEVAFEKIQVLADWNAAWPAAGQLPNPLLDRIVADPALLKRYRDIASDILERHFEPERLCAKIDANYALIKADLATDPFPHRRVTTPGEETYDDIVASMKQFVRKRYATAHEQLKTPGPRPKMTRPPDGPPQQLMAKIQRVQRAAETLQRNGGDLQPIQKLMQQVGPLLQKGQMDKAEKLIDEALKLAGEK